jgi:DUF4097 and DUF4098 domain-containing protein YvlB
LGFSDREVVMMTMRNVAAALGVLGLVTVALFLGGCEEEDVAGVFGAANVSATKVETVELPLEAPIFLNAETSNGSVTVRGVAEIQTVSVTVTLNSKGKTLEEAQDRLDRIVYHAEQLGNRIDLRYRSSEQDDDVRRYSGVEFNVLVPVETRVEVDTSNGAITVESIEGTILLDTSNGAIDVYDAAGSLTADTSNGRIEVVRFEGDLRLDTSNGEMWLEQVSGTVDAETSNGSVHYTGTPAAGGNRIRTSNGSITVRVPLHASIAFDASTSSGKIRSSLPLVGDTEGDEWNAQLNPPASITFDLRTSNGTIRIDGAGS